jgi:hypothetical protein
MGVGVADPSAVRGDAQQVLGHGQADQLRIGQDRFPAPDMPPGPTQRGQDTVLKMDTQCEQEGAEIGLHTSGLTPSARIQQSPPRQHQ